MASPSLSAGLLLPILLQVLLAWGLSAAEGVDLLALAESRRVAAEAALLDLDRRIAADRSERARALDSLESGLRDLRAKAKAAAAERARLQGLVDGAEAQRSQRRRALDQQQAAVVAALSADAVEESALRGALDRLLRELAEGTIAGRKPDWVFDRSGQRINVQVERIGIARQTALGADRGQRGLLERQDGLPHRVVVGPVIPPEPSWPAVVIDVDGSLLSREPARSAGLLGWFHNGGAAMWPLALVALLACAVICERLVFLLGSCLKTERILAVEQALAGEDPDKARSLCADGGAVGRVLAAGLADINATVAQREAALEAALLAEAPRLERGLGLLAALGAVAPLLGLLGTVTGMIATFETIAVHGTGNPRLLSGGIGIALITTQAGLFIAVPVLLAHALIGRVIERRLLSLEGMAVALLAREQADRPSVEGGR